MLKSGNRPFYASSSLQYNEVWWMQKETARASRPACGRVIYIKVTDVSKQFVNVYIHFVAICTCLNKIYWHTIPIKQPKVQYSDRQLLTWSKSISLYDLKDTVRWPHMSTRQILTFVVRCSKTHPLTQTYPAAQRLKAAEVMRSLNIIISKALQVQSN